MKNLKAVSITKTEKEKLKRINIHLRFLRLFCSICSFTKNAITQLNKYACGKDTRKDE